MANGNSPMQCSRKKIHWPRFLNRSCLPDLRRWYAIADFLPLAPEGAPHPPLCRRYPLRQRTGILHLLVYGKTLSRQMVGLPGQKMQSARSYLFEHLHRVGRINSSLFWVDSSCNRIVVFKRPLLCRNPDYHRAFRRFPCRSCAKRDRRIAAVPNPQLLEKADKIKLKLEAMSLRSRQTLQKNWTNSKSVWKLKNAIFFKNS